MKTIKGTKNNLIKEYKKYIKDLYLCNNIYSIKLFVKDFINNEIMINGIFYNKNLKTINIEEIKDELVGILLATEFKKIFAKLEK